jgi:hypothetical protein
MSKKNIILAVLGVLVVAGVAYGINKASKEKEYSVVYMSTGEVYVGKLRTFPDLRLENGYVLQVTKDEKDPNKNNFQLQPVKDALWAPKRMHLIKDNVIFYGPLMSNSKIAETLAAQKK